MQLRSGLNTAFSFDRSRLFRRLIKLGGLADQLIDVCNPVEGLIGAFRLQLLDIAGLLDHHFQDIGNILSGALTPQLLNQANEFRNLRGTSPKSRDNSGVARCLHEACPAGCRIVGNPQDSCLTDPPLRRIYDPPDGEVICSVRHCAQIGQDILDFPACVEIHAADDGVRHIFHQKLFLKCTGLGICPVQNGTLPILEAALPFETCNIVDDVVRLLLSGVKPLQRDLSALPILRPERLPHPSLVVRDHCVRRIQDGLR